MKAYVVEDKYDDEGRQALVYSLDAAGAKKDEQITRPEEKQIDELAEHRKKWRKKAGVEP